MKKKKKELTVKQLEFIQSYERNAGNTARICQELNITPSRCVALMSVPSVKERLARSVEVASEMIKTASPELARIALELAMNENVNVKVRASLIDSLLDRAGVTPPKSPLVEVNINTSIADRARSILAEREEKKKQVLTIDVP